MSLVKWRKEDDWFPTLSSAFDDFFGKNMFGNLATGTTVPAVNIHEGKHYFEVEVAAPGLKKEDFKVDLNHNVLTISAERKEEKEEKEKKKVTRREFSYTSFERSFTLPETVDTTKISGNYNEGVLKITLPKKEAAKEIAVKKIEIH